MDSLSDQFRPRESLRRRLAIGIGIPLLIAFVAMVIIQAHLDQQMLVDRVRQEMRADAGIACAGLEAELLAIEHSVSLQAQLLRTRRAGQDVLDSEEARRRISALLRSVVETNGSTFGAAFAFAPGQPGVPPAGLVPYVCRMPDSSALKEMDLATVPGYDFLHQRWYTGATLLPDGTWSEPYFDTGGGDVYMSTYSVRFPATSDTPSGVATADLAIDRVLSALLRNLQDKLFDVSLISGRGQYIASTLEGAEMKSATDFPPEDLRAEVLGAAVDYRSKGEEFVRIGGERLLGYGGTRVVFLKVPSTNWVLAGSFSEKDLLPSIATLLALGPGLLVVGAFVSLLLVWRSTGRAVEPLAGVMVAIQRFATGDLSARAPVPTRWDEIGTMARAFNSMGEELVGAITQRNKADAQRLAVEAQVAAARDIQRLLLPAGDGTVPDGDVRVTDEFPGVSFAATSVPASEIAGDFFDWFTREDGTIVVVIADVCGKGMPAAMMMAVGRTLIRRAAAELDDPAAALARVSDDLVTEAPASNSFTTGILLYVNPATGRIRYANAGHPSAVLVRADGTVSEVLGSTGTVLGLDRGLTWESGSCDLLEGERLVLVSDGVTEAGPEQADDADDQGATQFGSERTIAAVAAGAKASKSPRGIMESIVETVKVWSHGYQRDDLTVLVIGRTTASRD